MPLKKSKTAHKTTGVMARAKQRRAKPQPVGGRKTLAIRPHHARPFRKRHYGLLMVALAVAFFLFGVAVSWSVRISTGQQDAQALFNKLFGPSDNRQLVVSNYGFSFKYDPGQYFVSAVSAADGKLYVGEELDVARPYQTLKLTPSKLASNSLQDKANPNTVTLDYLLKPAGNASLALLEDQNIAVVTPPATTAPVRVSSKQLSIDGHQFLRTIWAQPGSGPLAKQLPLRFVTYTTVLDGKPLILRTNNRLTTGEPQQDIDTIASSLHFGQPAASANAQQPAGVAAAAASSRSLLSSSLFSRLSAAASAATNQPDPSQLNSALYSPAVVKIFNAYCTDITINGKLYLTRSCDALSGSGFFVSADGYIATNGHVATSNAKDLVLTDAYVQAASGQTQYLLGLAHLAGLSDARMAAIQDPAELLDTIFNAVYNLPDSTFGKVNSVSNLLVDLTGTEPDIETLVKDTEKLKEYPGTKDIKQAKLVTANYRAWDGLTKWRKSDVALIKVDGSHYPTVTLGSIGDVSQGSELSIMGYPGAAQGNGLVSAKTDSVTLTTGKVSAIKTANGDSRKLIQTDTTIGHGNSGGPALDDDGNVVGIATYSIDASGEGGGVFNYVRDIADLKTLASSEHITVGEQSDTQQLWQKAITAFYSSHYSKSLKYFDQVKQLDPEHPTVDAFEANAKQAIKEGKDVKDFPVVWVLVGAGVALVIAGVAVFLIVRQHGHHQIYKLATGQTAAVPVNFGGGMPQAPGTPGAAGPQPPVTPGQPQAIVVSPQGQAPAPAQPQPPTSPAPPAPPKVM